VLTSTAFGQESKILPHMVVSNVRFFVEQQQYFFETLWNKAIPAKQRIKEIEEGAKREFVETIRDSSEIEKIGFELIKSAEEEILLLFSKPNAFFLQEKARVRRGRERLLALLKEAAASPRNVKVRILIPIITSDVNNNNDDDDTDAMTTTIANERIILQQLKELGIDVRSITLQHQENFLQNNSSNSNLTLLIVDQSSYMTVELSNEDNNTKEETSAEKEEEDAIILATYSNTEATVFAYVSIFENLWMKTQV
jgi:hypothetical protein